MHATTRSIFPDTIGRSEQKWSFANSSHFFPSIFPFFFSPPLPFHYSIHVAIATPHATSRIKRNASTAVANFGKQAPRAFHFAVIYGRPILQIRHSFGGWVCIGPRTGDCRRKRVVHGVNGACTLPRSQKIVVAGWKGEQARTRWVGASGTDFEGANPSHGRGDSIQFFRTIGNIRSAGIEG